MQAKQLNLVPLYVALLVLSVVAIFAMVAKSVGIALNVTGSMPDLVYQLGHGEKGSLASFCSPIPHPSIGHGSCRDGSLPLIKRVVGVAGDRVTATDHGVEINGQPVPNSRPLDLDTKGQALPHVRGIFTLKQGEIWTAGEHPNSFDSRYFGPVKCQGVTTTTGHPNPCSDLSNSDRFAERVRQGGRIESFDQKSQPFRSNETTDSGVSLASHSNSRPQPVHAHTG